MLTLAVLTASAQRYSCIRPSERAGTRKYAIPETKTFDPQKTYRQPVILVTCTDADFSMADPANFYNRVFNEVWPTMCATSLEGASMSSLISTDL